MTRYTAIIILTLIVSLIRSAPAEPATPPLLTIKVSDIPGLLDAATSQSVKLSGQSDGAGIALKTQFAIALGDPQLLGLPPGTPCVIYVWTTGQCIGCVRVSPAMLSHYVQSLTRLGIKASIRDEILVVTAPAESTPTHDIDIETAKADLQEGTAHPSIIAHVNVRQFLTSHASQVEEWIRLLRTKAVDSQYKIASTAEGQKVRAALEQMAEVWFRTYLAIAKRTESLNLQFTVPENGFRADLTFDALNPVQPIHGTRGARRLVGILPESGAVRCGFTYNPTLLGEFVSTVANENMEQMQVDEKKKRAWLQLINAWFKSSSGSVAMSLMEKENPGFNSSFAIGLSDPIAGLQMLRDFPQAIRDSGVVDLYAKAGVKLDVQFEENRRTHNATPIHRMTYKMEITSVDQLPLGAMGLTDLSARIAIVDTTLLVTMGSASIDALVDSAKDDSGKKSKGIHAAEVLDPGGRMYMDYNLVQALSATARVLPPTSSNLFKNLGQSGKTTATLSLAGYSERSGYRVSAFVPTDLIVAVRTARSTASANIPTTIPGSASTTSSVTGGR